MTRFQLSTFRTGLLVSALGVAGLVLAGSLFVTAFVGEGTLARLNWSGPLAIAGLLLTVAGFATMNVGAVRSGSAYRAVDFPDEPPLDGPTSDESSRDEPARKRKGFEAFDARPAERADGPRY